MTQPQSIAQYELLAELGRGGFATVYRAHDTRMGREVALKVIHNVAAGDPTFVQRFQQEARTAANLRHPNIVPVYDFGEADGALYLAMALVGQGRTLRDLLAEQAPVSLEHTLPILAPLADALDYLHRRDPPLVHRDLKPANILLEGEGDTPTAVLTDFGLVHLKEASVKLTKSDTILGTLAYMAPEQADPKQWGEITALTDVYALGVVAYEMLTGRVPFEGEAPAVLHAHAYEEPPSPLEFLPQLSEGLDDILARALAKPPAERYPSADALVTALRQVVVVRTEAAEREATLEQLEAQARELLDAGEWLEALDRCTQMVRLDPDRPAALEMLTAAKQGLDKQQAAAVQRRRLEERYAEGVQLLEEAQWKQAIAALEEVARGNPDFRDVQDKLAQAHDEHQRAQWHDEAIAHGEAGRWAEACRLWVQVLRGRLDYRDGEAAGHLLDATEGLLGQRDKLEKWAREATSLYDAFVVSIRAEDWGAVVEKGEELLKVAPGLSGPQAWLAHAYNELMQRGIQEVAEGILEEDYIFASLTDIGLVMHYNEDFIGTFRPSDPAQHSIKGDLFIVAGGTRTQEGDHLASKDAAHIIAHEYYTNPDSDVASSLVHAIQKANAFIHRQAQQVASPSSVATTVVAAGVRRGHLVVANVGNNRAYLVRHGDILQITRDHTFVAEQIEAGIIAPEEAQTHPQRTKITRTLGLKSEVYADVFERRLQQGDVLLLCSDGLTEHVEDEGILDVVGRHSPGEAVRRLVDLANMRGGSDNISVVIFKITRTAEAS